MTYLRNLLRVLRYHSTPLERPRPCPARITVYESRPQTAAPAATPSTSLRVAFAPLDATLAGAAAPPITRPRRSAV